ncbi:MAG TPA: GNAT family N-acetyltransferase [Anaerolineales bacterium]|nr:GNAT family N-acetyltransferase [Anaerolineales bacterium]
MNNFSLRSYAPSDVQSVVDVINASSTLTVGFPRAVVDAVGNLWAYRFIPFSSEKVVAINEQSDVVGYAYFTSTDHHIVAETGGAVHPEFWGKGIGTALVKWAEDHANDLSSHAPTGIKSVLQTTLFESEPDAIKLFTDRGYSKVREWMHLVIEMEEPPIVPALAAPNLILREMDLDHDWGIVEPAMDEAYADHWGAISLGTFEAVEQEKSEITESNEEGLPEDSSYSNAPGYCFIVLDGDTVAGGILCNAKLVERTDTGRVGSMFIRPRYRRQGIARTLMLAAFDAFWKNGFRRVITDTDAKSFTDAPKLYKGMGMQPYRSEFTLEKEIRSGREVRRLD